MRFIPYGKQTIDDSDINEVLNILRSDWITTGPKVDEFERKLAEYVGSKYAVAVNSGTSALDIAVSTLGIPKGSEIITTPFTFVADANAILYNNHKPVFADINAETFNIDPNKVKEKITSKTKAIIYVDYAGQPCQIDELKEIAQEHDLYLIEDASHALGAEYKGKKVGSFADMTIFSFHPVKPITTGEGGAVTTDNAEFYEKLKMLRNHGMDNTPRNRVGYKYDIKLLGRNYRITDFQCALGISQLKKLDSFIKRRNEIADIYNREFEDIDRITPQKLIPNVKSGYHIYPILLDKKINRDKFFVKMREKGVGVNVHYIPIYKFTLYKKLEIHANCPNTDDVYSRIITLPVYPKMSEDDVNFVVDAVKETVMELV